LAEWAGRRQYCPEAAAVSVQVPNFGRS